MCWTWPVSLVMTLIGLVASLYLWRKKESKLLWVPIFYFSLMEFLQFLTYFTINTCTPANQIYTVLGYIHILFQPFFINALLLYFVPKDFRKKIIPWVFTLCFITAVLMIIKLYPFTWAQTCPIGEVMCGEALCSVDGNFHLAWEIPFSDFPGFWAFIMFSAFPITVFILPFIYGSWKAGIYHILLGPVLAYSLTQNPNEWPAVWCLLSIAYLLIILIPPLRKRLAVKKWYFWKFPK